MSCLRCLIYKVHSGVLTGHSAVSSAREASALNSFSLTHSIRSVKNFFLFYSKKFEVPGNRFCVFSASSEAARISYYAFPLLSTPFSSFFPLFSPLEKLTNRAWVSALEPRAVVQSACDHVLPAEIVPDQVQPRAVQLHDLPDPHARQAVLLD